VEVQDCGAFVAPTLVNIINQDANSHTPVGSLEETVNKQVPHDIIVNHIILGIDAALGNTRQCSAGNKCIKSIIKQVKA
jgi:hypothetical protein